MGSHRRRLPVFATVFAASTVCTALATADPAATIFAAVGLIAAMIDDRRGF
jgi:hypothetical protein